MRPVTVAEALAGLRLKRVDTTRGRDGKLAAVYATVKPGALFKTVAPDGKSWFNFARLRGDQPSRTIPAMPVIFHHAEPRLLAIPEVRRLCSFPDDFILPDGLSFAERWERFGRSVPPLVSLALGAQIRTMLDGRRGRMPIGARYEPYTMADVRAVPTCGLTVISTFSGCGGSSLGYRMAGLSCKAALEFDTEAADTYEANFPGVPILREDVRKVRGADLLAAAQLRPGQLDVLDGSPPCASFSTAGRREKGWGQEREYSGQRQRTDDLFFEFARLVEEIKPKAFVGENVSGLTKGKARGYFNTILELLRSKGYRVGCQLIDAAQLGVPQHRQRVFYVGFREDLGLEPVFPRPIGGNPPTLREALRGLAAPVEPEAYTVPGTSMHWITERMREGTTAAEVMKAVKAGRIPPPTDADGPFAEKWRRKLAGEGGKEFNEMSYFSNVRLAWDAVPGTVQASHGQISIACGHIHPTEPRKLSIAELRRVCSFPEDFALTGDFGERWERFGRSVPPFVSRAIGLALWRALDGRP